MRRVRPRGLVLEHRLARRRLLGALALGGLLPGAMSVGAVRADGPRRRGPRAITARGTAPAGPATIEPDWIAALRGAFGDLGALGRCGRAWREARPRPADARTPSAEELDAAWRATFGVGLEGAAADDGAALHARYAHRRERELRERRLVQLDGWLFAACERELALLALRAEEHLATSAGRGRAER